MDTSELDYDLPERLIAQQPAAQRDAARLLVVNRAEGSMREDSFANLGSHLDSGDCLVLNDTRVIRARLRARKETGGKVELFLLRERHPATWEALVRPSGRLKPGTTVLLAEGITARVGEDLGEGRRLIVFDREDVLTLLERTGEVPLPPYIHRDEQDPNDAARYQTVYAAHPGAVAAPTAGLHYTDELIRQLESAGIGHCTLTLHVGYGTFKPITAQRLEDHRVEAEDFSLSPETAARLNETRAGRGRIVAVGTTSTRVLESTWTPGGFTSKAGQTDLYIQPGHTFQAIDALQTNFHLPRSSLLALVAAFAGRDLILEAYRYAIERDFRFYSYGDAMLIL